MSTSPWARVASSCFRRLSFWLAFAVTLLFAVSSYPGFAQTSSQPTDFSIGDTVLHAPVKRLGIDLGGQNYYDSGQMMRDLIFRNPGFEGQDFESVIGCGAVTTTSCTDQNPWNAWTADFLKGATFEVINGAAKGETGVVTGNTISDFEAGNTSNPTKGVTISFAPLAVPLAKGDYVIVRMSRPGDATAGWWTSTSGGATLTADTTDIAPDSPGKQALQMNADANGQSASVNEAFDTWSGRSFIQLKGTYTLEFKAKGLGGNNQLNVSVARLATAHGNENFLNQNVALTNQWKDYSYTFTANEDGTYVGPVQVVFSVSGTSADLDDVALMAPAAPDNPTAFRNAVVDALRQLHPGVIRYMTGTDFGASTADIVAVPFARRPADSNPGTTVETDIPMGLEEFLVLCKTVGAEPWYTLAGGASTEDMKDLIEFLGGSPSTPYGAIRASLGQVQPWTSVFPKIHIELGNEMWNGVMVGEAILNPVAYGQRAADIFAAAHAAPGFDPSKFDLIMGSWAAVPWYTQQEMLNSSGYNSVDAAPYLYYSLSDYSSNEAIFGPMFAQPEQLDSRPNGYMAQQAATAAAGNPPAKLDVYEVNLSTVSGTAPQNVVNGVVAGVGAGITVADHMLLMLRDLDITTQNMFSLTEFQNGFRNTATGGNENTPLWGAVIDMGGPTNRKRPTFLAEELANSAIMPTMLKVGVSGANPTWNQPLSANDDVTPIQIDNAHYLQSFAFTDGTNYSIVIMNLSRSGSLPVTFSGAHAPSGSVLVSQLTSSSPMDNNETSDVVHITHTDLEGFNPATPYSLPPFSMTAFQWPNSSLPATTTTISADPTSGTTGQAIELSATVSAASAANTPTGTVTFMNGSASLGTAQMDANGFATLSVTTLPAGADSITAVYGGDASNAGSMSSAVTVNITSNSVATTTTLVASPLQAAAGDKVTFTATVKPQSGNSVPAGSVTFYDGAVSLGTATLNGSGVATFATTSMASGAHSITASYGGSASSGSSISSATTVTITQQAIDTATSLIVSPTQVTTGTQVTFTAKVAPQSGTGVPAGTVTFLDGGTTLGKQTLDSGGTASFSTTALAAGNHSITASYSGSDADTASISNAVTVTVSQGTVDTTTSLSASASQVNAGQNVIFTATVAAKSGKTSPQGTVTFYHGAAGIGTAAISASGVATLNISSLPAGTNSITAAYNGAQGWNGSVSSAVVVSVATSPTTVTHIQTAVSLTVSNSQPIQGANVTFTASIVPQSGSGVPTGTVTFSDGQSVLGKTPASGGQAVFSTSGLGTGKHQVTAAYSGDSSYAGAVSTAVTVQVGAGLAAIPVAAATVTTLTASSSQVNQGDAVTFDATVQLKSGGAVTQGSVTFLDGQDVLGTGALDAHGAASFSTSSLPVGNHNISATYGGSSGAAASASSLVTVTVASPAAPQYSMTLSASDVRVKRGQVANLTVTLTPLNGFHQPVHLSCSGMLPGTNCSFSPAVVTPNGKPVSSTLSILAQPPSGNMKAEVSAPGHGSLAQKVAFGALMPWGILALFGLRRKRRSRFATWAVRLGLVAALIVGSFWMSGCGYSMNQSAFTMTVTSSGHNIPTHTSKVTVNVVP